MKENRLAFVVLIFGVSSLILIFSLFAYGLNKRVTIAADRKRANEEITQSLGNADNSKLVEVTGVDVFENIEATKILEDCGITNIKYIDFKGEFEDYSLYYIEIDIDVDEPEFEGIEVYFSEENIIQRIKYREGYLYKDGEYLATVNDYILSDEDINFYQNKVMDTMKSQFKGTNFHFGEGGYYVYVNKPKGEEVIVWGMVEYTDVDGKTQKETFHTEFSGKEMKNIILKEYNY